MVGERLHMSIKIVKHKNMNSKEIEKICLLKEQHWTHGLTSQIEWINKQFLEDDFHVMKYVDNNLVAYVGINKVKCSIDNIDYELNGIGNVCVDKRCQGKGHGVEIMEFVENFLIKKDIIGILLCHKNLCDFYSKVGWSILEYSEAFIKGINFTEYIMTYNSKIEKISSINIDKNF